jgi:peptide chain release factor subunit 1
MDFISNESLSPQIKNKIIKVIDIAQGSEEGLKLAVDQAKDIITDAILLKEKQIISDFFEQVNKNCEKVKNGFKQVSEVISIGIAETVIICKDKFGE